MMYSFYVMGIIDSGESDFRIVCTNLDMILQFVLVFELVLL